MNPRVITAVTGSIILILGLAGLFYPDRVMGVLGYSVLNSAQPAAVLGEVRATYGGLFVVMGVFTLLAVYDPSAQRSRLTLIGLLWLGACAGRILGTSIDGTPGLIGWLGVAFELLMGSSLVAAGWIKPATLPQQPQPVTVTVTPSSPAPPA